MIEGKKKGNNNSSKKKKKTIITIEEEIIGPYSVNYVKRKEIVNNNNKAKQEEVVQEEDVKALESIRRKAIADLQSEETTAQQKIDAGWRLLQSFGFEEGGVGGNKPQKPWKWFEREGGYYY